MTVPTQAIKAWQKTKEKPAQRDKHMLHDVSARFEAGSLTLVLGPPQSGKSCLLRCIAGLLRPAGKSSLKAEEISFNGDPVYPSITGGEKRFEPTRVAAYMDEIDRHSPSLTPVWKSKFYCAFVLNRRVVLHAIDATLARWRGNADSSPLDGASTAASSP